MFHGRWDVQSVQYISLTKTIITHTHTHTHTLIRICIYLCVLSLNIL